MAVEEEELIVDSEEERESLVRSTITSFTAQNNNKKEKEVLTISSSSDSEIENNNINVRRKDSTSHWFPNKTTTSPTKRRKTKSPPPSTSYSSSPPVQGSLLLPTSHQPIASTSTLPASISTTDFKVPKLPSTSKSSSSSKKKVRTSSSQFTSASTLLKTSPKLSSSHYDKYNTGIAGVESKEKNSFSSQSSEDESTSKNLPLPPRLDTTDITRILHSLPPLIRKPSSSSSTANSTSSSSLNSTKRRKPWEITEIPLESINPEDVEGVDKMRNSLAQFKYRDTSTTISTASTSTNTDPTSNSTTEDFTLEDYLESVHHRPSASTTSTTTKMMNLSPPAPPLILPPSSRIQILTTCPLCSIPWTTVKTLSTKSTHLRNCATVHSYSSETVIILIENWILEEGKKLELERRERERNKSLFDRVVGKGEGKSKWREVEAVGVGVAEEGELVGGVGAIRKRQEDKRRVEELQKELEASFKKEPVDKVVKIANEIKLARKEEEERKIALRKQKELEEDEMELEYWQDEDLINLPRPTGRLEVHSTARKAAVVIRANKVLNGKGGTGLTQIPQVSTKNKKMVVPRGTLITPSLYPPTSSTSKVSLPPKEDVMQIDESDQDLPLPLPPSTQIFEPSKLAQRLVASGSIQGVLVPSKGLQRSLSPLTTICTEDSVERERSSSLWAAASGIDNEIIEKVVRSSSTFLPSSPPPSQPFGPYQNQRSPPHPSSSTTFFNSSPLLTPQKRHPHLFPSSATSVSSSSSSLKSNSPASPTLRITTNKIDSDSDSDDNNSLNENSSPIKIISPRLNKNLSLQRLVPIDLVPSLPLLLQQEKNQLLGSVEDLDDDSTSEEREEEEEEVKEVDVKKGKGKEVIEIDSSSEEEEEEEEEERGDEEWNDGEDAGDGMLVWNGADSDQEGRSVSDEEEDKEEEEEIIIVTTKDQSKKGKSAVVVLEDTSSSPSSASISSSEEEPLAQVILTKSTSRPLRKPRPIKKSKSKSKINSPPPPSEAQLLGAPDYTTFTTIELQTKVKKYGFKVSKERSVLIDQLEKVWLALNGTKGVVGGGTGKEKKMRKKKVVDVEEGEEEEAIELRIRKLIFGEESLYLRVLRYEPIFFEDFVSLITSNGIKLARPNLMKILDELCITIYTQDPAAGTNKPRTRHR